MLVTGLRSIWQNAGQTEGQTEIYAACYIIKIRCKEAASRNEREKRSLSLGRELKDSKGSEGYVLLNYKRKKWHGIIQTGNLETKTSAGAGVGVGVGVGVQRGQDASNVRRMRANPIYC